jgi:diacylglycerol kinase (ATP)
MDNNGPDLSFSGRIRSVACALQGIRTMLCSQHNAWVHAAATIMVVVGGFLFRLSATEWCWIILAMVSVWTAEAFNTALEYLTDVASPDFHPLAGKAKDVAAGAVLIAAVGAVIIGLLVFGPRLILFIGLQASGISNQ